MIGIPIGIMNSVIGLKIYAITGAIKKYESIIKKKKKTWYNIVSKSKLNRTEFLISKGLIDSNVSNICFS